MKKNVHTAGKSRKQKKIMLLILEFVIILLLAIALFITTKLSKIEKNKLDMNDVSINDDLSDETKEAMAHYKTIALFGLDNRSNGSLGTSIMTLTTTPNQLTDGLEKSLMPLSKIGVPVHAIAMMMSIALRFIPILIEETDKIMKAQMARGADFESGNLLLRVKNMIPLLVPLFVSAFRRADDLAMAMEARCYNGGEGRTKMKPLRYAGVDHKAYVLVIGYFVVILLCRFFLPFPQ